MRDQFVLSSDIILIPKERTVVETPKPISIQIEDETRETDTTLGMKKGKLSLIVKQIKQVENADSDGSEV